MMGKEFQTTFYIKGEPSGFSFMFKIDVITCNNV